MIETTEQAISPAPLAQLSARGAMLAVGLLSFSALLLELGLTRLFSVVLFYHFAFLAISIALLGLGAGAVFAYLRREWLERWTISQLGATLCAANALIILAVVEIVLHSSVAMHLDWGNFGRLTVLYLAAAVPFFVTGLLFSTVFARHPARITQLYGADLLGGSLACLALVPLLNLIGGPNTILFAAVAVAFAGAAWADPRSRRTPAILAALLLALIAVNFRGRLIDIVYAKGMKRATPLFAKWNALSRLEVDEQGWAKVIVIDADASTYLMNIDPHHWNTTYQHDLMSAAPALANVLRPKGEYAIIGPGGGVDVQRAVANGSPSVTGIEINPIIVNDIMRDRFADYTYHLYEIPGVHIHVSDGRSFIRNSHDLYDVVQMTLVDTWASTAAGAFALSENNLYTVEAFREYFEHLKPDGMIAITRWEFAQPREALRVVSQAMEALLQLGVEDSRGNFIVVSDGPLDADGRPVLVLAKKSPFSEEEQLAVLRHIKGATADSAHLNLYVLYLPATAEQPGMAHPAFAGLIRSQDPRAFSKNYAYNVAPVTDNAPFFFFTLKPEQVFRNLNQGGIDWKVNMGIAILGLLLIISVVAVTAFLVAPLALSYEARSGGSVRLLYFIAIGLGYILVEVAFIQRFVLFLGNPTYALTVVIFLMLLSSGLGSLLSRRWFRRPTSVAWAIAVIVIALLACVFVLPRLLETLVGLSFAIKLLISALVLLPLGLAMGMPFPSGLRALSHSTDPEETAKHGAVEWAWAMNAASSVLGSVLAMVIAIQFGLNVTLACGAAAYLLALLLLTTFGKALATQTR
jgi:spermidine synthase